MAMHTIRDLLAEHPILGQFDGETLDVLAGCGRNVHYAPGEIIQQEGAPATEVRVLRTGDVAIEVAAPGRPPVVVETLHGGDLLGMGWLIPPYRTMFDARALTEVRAVALDAECLRGKCDAHPALGYQIFRHWMPHVAARFRAQRLQLLDLYGADA